MERMFQILAVALLVGAAVFLWSDKTEVAFVCGVLAACAFFLSIRLQFKQSITKREIEAGEGNHLNGEQIKPGS